MTDPKHATHVPGRGRYYTHPTTGETWPSVTNVLDTCVSKPALVPWAAKITAAKAWRDLPRMVAASRNPDEREALTKEIKAEVKFVKDTAADLGTRIHARVEALVLGAPHPTDDEVEPYAEQAVAWFDTWGVNFDRDVEVTEVTVVNRTHGYAGTADLLVHLRCDPTTGQRTPRKRWLWLVDYKSSTTRPATSTYPENGLQLAALRHGETVLLEDGTEEPVPAPIAGGAVLNLRQKQHAFIPLPCGDDALAAFTGALRAATYLHSLYGSKPEPITAPAPLRKAS